jgi:HAD superfamily hydrolase (TIGR01490 family)
LRAAFFDVDGTLTTTRVWKGLMDYFGRRGERRSVHALFLGLHYPLYFAKRLGLMSESSFRGRWAADLAWYFKGDTPQQAARVWDWMAAEYMTPYWRSDSLGLLEQHRAQGDLVVLVSSGPDALIRRIAQQLGAEHGIGTRFEQTDGHYTGRSQKPICIDSFKASLAQDYLRQAGLEVDLAGSYAYADSTSDLYLLEMVGHPVATYPDEGLRPIAVERGWQIFPNEQVVG